MKTTDKKFQELRIEAHADGMYSVIVDGKEKAKQIPWNEIVEVVRKLEESCGEQIQRQV